MTAATNQGMPLPHPSHDVLPFSPQQLRHPVLHLPLLLQVQKKRWDFKVRFLPLSPPKTNPPPQQAAVLFSEPRLFAPILGCEGQVSPLTPVLPLKDVSRNVRLRPLLVGLQSDQTVWAQRGDLGSAAERLEGLGGAWSCGGGRGSG